MASKKSKILAIAFCAAVMAGIHVNPVLAYRGQEDFNYQHNTTESGLNNPEIHHTVDEGKFIPDWEPVHPEGDVNCEEEVANSNITVGDMNKVTADLVENDEKINSKVDKVASDVKDLQEQVNNIETTTDTDTHVKEGAATVADNGDVTMDIVDKNGNDTGKDVTISGLASDSELEGVKNELQQQIDSIEVEDTNTQINEGTYTAEADGTVNMDVVDKVTGEVTENAVTIEGLASDKELATETQKRTEADTKLQANINAEAEAREKADADLQDKIGQEEMNRVNEDAAIRGEISKEHADRVAADQELEDKIGQEEMNRVNEDAAIRGEISKEHADRVAADQELEDKIGQEEMNRVNEDAAIRGEISKEHADRVAADQELEDKIGQEEMNRVNEDAAIRGEISKEHADRVAADQELENKIDQETTDREKADADLQADINAKEEQSKDRDEQLQANIDAEEQARKDADDALQADINAKEEQSKYRDEQLQQSIDIQREVIGADSTEDLQNAYSGTNYISDAENMVEADRKLDAAISDVNSRVDGIENRVDGLEDRIDKVGAMSAAIANLRTMGYDPAAPTEVAVGVGQYRDETGMALGLFHYPNRDFMLSLSVSTSGDEYMGGIGATWKFGRKSPEKVAEIKKAQAEADARRAEEQKLAKAEEMKKAAKEAKVQAQMERHAKLAAERAALEEA